MAATSYSQAVSLESESAGNNGSQPMVKGGVPADGQPQSLPSAPPGYENATFDDGE